MEGCWWVRPVDFLQEHGLSREREPSRRAFTRVEASAGNADAVGSIRAITRFRDGIYIASYKRGVELFEDPRVRIVWPRDGGGSREVISLFADGDAQTVDRNDKRRRFQFRRSRGRTGAGVCETQRQHSPFNCAHKRWHSLVCHESRSLFMPARLRLCGRGART